MEVRLAQPHEYETIGELTVDAYRDLRSGAVLGDYEEELRAVGDRADCLVLVGVTEDGAILGTVTYVPGPNTELSEFTDHDAAGIRMLAVDPRQQGKGVGMALTSACIDEARRQGRTRIVLHSTELMRAARALYERAGFVAAPDRDILITDPPHSADSPLHLLAYVLTL
jgi:GNAT superfamily N-acetyltransferase